MKRLIHILFVALSIFSIVSCESNNSFRTEAEVRRTISGTWRLVPIPRTRSIERWTFKDGTLTRKNLDGSTIDAGSYTIHTTITTPYIIVNDFTLDAGYMNAKWIIITLNNKILAIDKTAKGTNALDQFEFTKE